MATSPADISNMALDSFGHPVRQRIGDLQEGTDEAAVCLRHYGPALRQISRAAHWNFARRRQALRMLNDATGQTTQFQQQNNLPPTVGPGTVGMRPWLYEYAWPIDCCKARFVPVSYEPVGPGAPAGNITPPERSADVRPPGERPVCAADPGAVCRVERCGTQSGRRRQ